MHDYIEAQCSRVGAAMVIDDFSVIIHASGTFAWLAASSFYLNMHQVSAHKPCWPSPVFSLWASSAFKEYVRLYSRG